MENMLIQFAVHWLKEEKWQELMYQIDNLEEKYYIFCI